MKGNENVARVWKKLNFKETEFHAVNTITYNFLEIFYVY